MADSSQIVFDASSQVVDLLALKHIDADQLRNDGPEKIIAFLEEIVRGFDQGKKTIHVNIPFLWTENPSLNEYEFFLYPPFPDPNDVSVRPITLSHVINILDEILDWSRRIQYPGNERVEQTRSELGTSILQLQAVITENWLSDKPQLVLFKKQVDSLLRLFKELAPLESQKEGSLRELIILIAGSQDQEALALWNTPAWKKHTLQEIFTAFHELPTGRGIIASMDNASVHQLRLTANTYLDRIREVITHVPYQTLEPVSNEVALVSNASLYFDISRPEAMKSEAETVQIGNYVQTLNSLIPALLSPSETAEKPFNLLDTVLVNEKKEEDAASVETGDKGTTTDSPEPSIRPDAFEQQFGLRQQSSNISADSPLYEKNLHRYATISQHAGFLYNHITSNVFGLYPGLPIEYRSLPPQEMYQLRQDIVQYLYELSPQELSQLSLYGRFALGEELFRRLILRDPKLFVRIEHYVQAVSESLGIPITTPDPLHLEDRTTGFNHEQYIRDIPQSTQVLENLGEDNESATALQSATSRDVYHQSFRQNDDALKAGLAALGITELVPALRVRNVILSYIQTTGLDPTSLLTGRNASDLTLMFGVSVPENQAAAFATLVSSYWQYQLHKLQRVTNHRIVPNPALVELTETKALEKEDIDHIAAVNWEEHNAAIDGNEIRLTILASLTSTADLTTDSPQRHTLIQALSDLYENDQAQIEQAIRTIISIQRAQKEALAAEAAVAFSHQQFVAFQAQANEEADEAEAIATVPTGLAAFNALSPFEKQQLMNSIMLGLDPTQDAPQELYARLLEFNAQESLATQSQVAANDQSFVSRVRNAWGSSSKKVDQVSKGISRLKTIGAGSKKLAETAATTAAASTNPAGTAFGKSVGAGARAIFGDKVGGTIEKAAIALGSAGGVLSAIGTAITTAATFLTATLIPALGAILTFIGPGAFIAVGAAVGGLFAAGSAAVNQTVLKPFLGGGAGGSTASGAGTKIAGMQPGSLGYGAGAPPGGTPVATPTAAAQMSIGTIAPLVGLGGTAVATAVVTLTTHGAFLANLPTIGDKDISPYVVIEKVATPGTKFDTPTDITYTIRIRAKDGFKIQLTEAPTDEFSVTFSDRETDTTPRTPTDVVPTSPDHEAFKTALTTFHTDNPIITTEPITVGTYTIPFGSNPGEIDYTDANVRNIFSIKFNVLDVNGQPITDPNGNTVASTGEVICFGDCPQSQGGCWPTSGIINQLPYGHDSHGPAKFNSDAYDIGAPAGTPVYAPFEGEACEGNVDSVNYGNHVILKVSNTTYSSSGGGTSTADMHLMFAHLSSISSTLENSCQTVTPGFVLGEVGSTGNSTGPHLHYEAWFGPIASVNKKEPSLLMQYVPELVKLRDPVRSCYD